MKLQSEETVQERPYWSAGTVAARDLIRNPVHLFRIALLHLSTVRDPQNDFNAYFAGTPVGVAAAFLGDEGRPRRGYFTLELGRDLTWQATSSRSCDRIDFAGPVFVESLTPTSVREKMYVKPVMSMVAVTDSGVRRTFLVPGADRRLFDAVLWRNDQS